MGLSFGALYLAAVVGVGLAGVHFQHTAIEKQYLTDAKQWTYWLSRHLGNVQADGNDAVLRELRQASHEPGITYGAIVSPTGTIIAHSDASKIGQTAVQLVETDTESTRVRVAHVAGNRDQKNLIARIIPPQNGTVTHELRIGISKIQFAWTQSDIVFWAGYVLLAVLGLYLLFYRLLRRSVQPLAVIRNRLIGCSGPVPERLVALRLNDSYDQISTSWNQLIEFVSEMQEQLQRSELITDVTSAMDGYRSERLSDLLMQIPFGVLLIDTKETISFANRAACGMLGTPGEPMEGQNAAEVLEEELRTALLSSTKTSRSGQNTGSRWIDHTLQRSTNTTTLRFWSHPCDDNDYVIFVQDVTQAKQAEHARNDFLYHVTHEFRTPLTNIRAYAETLSQGVIEDEQTIRECYNVIMGETSRLGRLVEDLLSISQLEVGTAKLDKREIQLVDSLRKVVQDNQGSADSKNIDLVLQLPAKTPKVVGDRERLAVVFNNLIGNAIKYTPEGGRVEVACVAEKQRIEVAVSDTGIGIDPVDQEKVFEKFYRVDDERISKIPGTGLGLAIAKETVRAHSGTLTLTSTPDKGTTLTVTLPALAVDESGTDMRNTRASSQGGPSRG